MTDDGKPVKVPLFRRIVGGPPEDAAGLMKGISIKERCKLTCHEACGEHLMLAFNRAMLAIPSGLSQPSPLSSRIGAEHLVSIDKISDRLVANEGLDDRLEELFIDVLEGLLVSDERFFIHKACELSRKVNISGFSDSTFVSYIRDKATKLPGEYSLLLRADSIADLVANPNNRGLMDELFDPIVKESLAAMGLLGNLGKVTLLTDAFRYDTLQCTWPEGLVAIGIGPRSEVGMVEHSPPDIRCTMDEVFISMFILYHDFLKEGECVSFWKKGD